jgi:nucleoid-associated protein YgaU
MSDVEKYGLFAVVFVGGLLLVIALQGGFSGTPEDAPVLIGSEPAAAAATTGSGAPMLGNRVRVKPILPDTSFDWDEAPIAYPGERSSAMPAMTEEPASLQVVAPAGRPVAVSAPKAPAAPAGMHVVAQGETLSSIAAKYLGSESRWKDLATLNPGLDPKKLKPGMQLRVTGVPEVADATPARTEPAPAAATSAQAAGGAAPPAAKPAAAKPATAKPAGRTHTVVKGDTLGAIAKTYLGSATRADDLYAANKDVLKSKDDLKLGQVLRIP